MDKSQRILPQYGLAPIGEVGRRPQQVQQFDPLVSEFGDEGGAKGLFEYWRIILRYKVVLLLFVLVGGVLGFLDGMTQTPIYRAQTNLEIQGFNENFMNGGEINATFGSADILTLTEIMGSTTVIERVVKRLKIDESIPPSTPWEPSFVDRAMGVLPPHPMTPLQRAAQGARGGLEILPSNQARVVSIGYSSPDPEHAATFANTLADEFVNYSLEMRWNSAQRTHDWLTKQLAEFKSQLQVSERDLQAYARDSALLFTNGDASVSEERLRQMQASLSDAHADRVTKQSQYELALSSPLESLPEVLDYAPVTDQHMRLAELRRELAQLESTLTPAHYKVKEVQAQIAEVSRSLEGERVKIADRIRNQYEGSLRRERMLQSDYEKQAGLVTDEAQKSIQYNLLKRDVETNRQLYDGMLQRMKEASVIAAMKATNIRVIDPATPPSYPSSPNLPQQTVMGVFGGLLFGFGFVLLREWGNRSLKTPGDVSFYLKLPELGVIPSARRVSKGIYGLGRFSIAPSVRKLLTQGFEFKNGTNGNNGDVEWNGKTGSRTEQGAQPCIELATWQHKTSLLAECYRAALTSILFSSQHGETPKVILLSSPSPGEGKTSTVSNLGIALAEIGRRVVLIDGDMRRPRLHRIFGLPGGSRGLTDLLRSGKSIDLHPIESLVQATEVPGLFVLPGGSGAVNISNLLYSPRMTELLERLKGEFDTVLIDSPPMLQIPDARVLGRMADAVILVVRAGQTNRDSAAAAAQRFAEDHTPVLGTILNGWDPRDSNAGFYDGYHEYYKATGKLSLRDSQSMPQSH